jgi:hypothetical protein
VRSGLLGARQGGGEATGGGLGISGEARRDGDRNLVVGAQGRSHGESKGFWEMKGRKPIFIVNSWREFIEAASPVVRRLREFICILSFFICI